ncbi:ABC transporter ATP-binding protein [Amycolatopsis carbonis]|uniref:ABC-type quaternary amine transporter n=1 Tax=Amycolatopsis carbonis TaxID=715471 RepID=A0A9Y2MVX5_9PSEU|nr:ABC transporter ATP-binding protein [Amycolatopsis sp. 2-15]WIX77364.1 ABC transporter ATP-binding protein [Amycolatopsis sp. 2-15]
MALHNEAEVRMPATTRSRAADVAAADARTEADVVLAMRGVTVDYGATRVLHEIDLSVRRGELIALLGPSGSGKTTMIRTIAGFAEPAAGQLLLHGRDLAGVPVHRRNIGLVFQSYALFPHLSVADNIAYPLKVQKKGRAAIKARVAELVELVQLAGHAGKRPARLSGGQQQRVSLARALAMDPELLLLDEPLSNLDANLRREVGEEIRRLQQRTGTTTIMVTHDRQEAFGMADRMAVLREGRIEQLDTPREVYRRPVNAFMAGFAGDANLLSGTVTATGELTEVTTAAGVLVTGDEAAPGADVVVLVRPEDVRIEPPAPAGPGLLAATIAESFFYGSSLVVQADAAGTRIQALVTGTASTRFEAGQQVSLRVDARDAVLLPRGAGA